MHEKLYAFLCVDIIPTCFIPDQDRQHLHISVFLYIHRGRQWESPRWAATTSSNPQRPDKQPDCQTQVLLHLQDIPTAACFTLQYL